MSQIISYTATSGDRVEFSVGQPGLTWLDVAGVYMFCARTEGGVPVPVYIGQAESFRDTIPNHPLWQEACTLGAMAVLVKTVAQAQERARLAHLLLAEFAPCLNDALPDAGAAAVYRFGSRACATPTCDLRARPLRCMDSRP